MKDPKCSNPIIKKYFTWTQVITFTSFDHNSCPLFMLLGIIIFPDLVK